MKPVAGLAAALICALVLCPIPPRHLFTDPELVTRSMFYISVVIFAAVIATVFIQPARNFQLRMIAAAVWCAPLVVWTIHQSALAAVPLVLFVVSATPLFGLTRETPGRSDSFELLRQFPSSLMVALLVQFAVIEALLHHAPEAAILLSAGAALLAWRATAIDPRAPARPRWAVVTVFASLLLVIAGLLPFRAMMPGAAGSGTGSGTGGTDRADGSGAFAAADSYRGIILLPEIQEHVTLIPPLPALSRDPFRERKQELQIPFYGVYWFFRRPDSRPPGDSIEMHGVPSNMTFRSQDRRPLVMEAHQSLGTPFRLSCCRAIELAITNRNRTEGTVSIELILVDTFEAAKPHLSLGVLPVHSVLHWSDKSTGISEVLDYPIPAAPPIAQFDEFTIRFHRPYQFARESANVAIDGFTLKPR